MPGPHHRRARPCSRRGHIRFEELTARLEKAPRRRNYKMVPMILNHPDQWDHEALSKVISDRVGFACLHADTVARSMARYQLMSLAVPIIRIKPVALIASCAGRLSFHSFRTKWPTTESRMPRQKN